MSSRETGKFEKCSQIWEPSLRRDLCQNISWGSMFTSSSVQSEASLSARVKDFSAFMLWFSTSALLLCQRPCLRSYHDHLCKRWPFISGNFWWPCSCCSFHPFIYILQVSSYNNRIPQMILNDLFCDSLLVGPQVNYKRIEMERADITSVSLHQIYIPCPKLS